MARCHQLWTVNRLPSAQSACRPVQEADAVVDAALHLVDVHDGVGRPHVVVVALHGGQAVSFGQLVVAALFEAEGVHAAHVAVVRVHRVDGGERAADAIAQVGGVAEEEVELVADEQAEQVGGPADQQGVEAAGGAVPVAGEPGVEHGAVGGLPLVERQGFQVGGDLAGAGHVGQVGRGEREVGGQDLTHREVRLVGGERCHGVQQLVAVGEEVVDGGVVAVDGRLRAGDRIAVDVGAGGEREHCVSFRVEVGGSGAVEDPEREAKQRHEPERFGARPAEVAEHAGHPQVGCGSETFDGEPAPVAAPPRLRAA